MPHFSLPFHQSDLPEWYALSEGYFYAATVWRERHGNTIHAGIDYDVPYGTPIYSPVEGYASASYNIQRARHEDASIRTHDDTSVTYSLGYCIQIYHPQTQLFLLYGHLSYISEEIVFTPPFTTDTGEQFARGFNLTSQHVASLDQCSRLVHVTRGQYLWDVWVSGIYLTDTLVQADDRPHHPLPEHQYIYYSHPHLHRNTYDRSPDGSKQTPIDPYDIYDTADLYPDPSRPRLTLWPDHLMKLWDDGMIQRVDQ